MKWLERAVLLALGTVVLVQEPVGTSMVAAFIAAVAASCFAAYFRKTWFIAAVCAVWTALSLLQPAFSFFWPLLVYDTVLCGAYPLIAFPAICFAVNGARYTGATLPVLVASAAAAVLLGLRARKSAQLEREVRGVRDDAMEANLALDRKNKELVQEQGYELRIATLTERGRIAREIHDSVGHMLSRAMLQTGAAAAVNQDERMAGSLSELKDTLELAMNSVRSSVHDLRDESFDLRALVEGCIRDFSAYESNLNYDMGKTVPHAVQECFAAVIREAFANVQRHSNATHIGIDLQEHPAFYKLRFEDNGMARPQARGGMGLQNMRERAQALGGRCEISNENGFRIHIMIPKEGKELA